jgi:hypothetical protein
MKLKKLKQHLCQNFLQNNVIFLGKITKKMQNFYFMQKNCDFM